MSGSPVLFPETDPMGKRWKSLSRMENKKMCSSHFSGLQLFYQFKDLFGDCFFFMMACLFFTCNPFAVKQTRTLHKKKNTSHCCCASSQNTKAVDKSCGIQRVGDRRSLSTRKKVMNQLEVISQIQALVKRYKPML